MKSKGTKGFWKRVWAMALLFCLVLTGIPNVEYRADDDVLDYTKPVIESAEFHQNGQVVMSGSRITFELDAYDADSGIWYGGAEVITEDGKVIDLSAKGGEDETTGNYMWGATLDPEIVGECQIKKVYLVDDAENVAEFEVDFSFTVEKAYVDESMEITFSADTYTASVDNETPYKDIEISASVTGTDRTVYRIIAVFTNSNGEEKMVDLYNEFQYIDTIRFGGTQKSDTFVLSEVSVQYQDDWSVEYFATVPDCKMVFENNITDRQGPVITDVSIDKQGQIVESGEVVVTVWATDEGTIDLENAYVYLESPLDISETHIITLDEVEKGQYTGTISVDEMYSCEWYISRVSLKDKLGNVATTELNYENYYFYVKTGDAFVDKVYKNINFSLYDQQKNLIKKVTVDVPRRSTLAEALGEDYISFEKDDVYGAHLGWSRSANNKTDIYTKDSVIDFIVRDNQTCRLYPCFEKMELQYTVSYLDQKGNVQTEIAFKVIDYGTTYGEFIKDLKTPENVGESKYIGWANYDSYVENDPITSTSLSIYAEYDKYEITIGVAYLDANKNVVRKNITKYYDDETTLNEMVEECIAELDDSAKNGVVEWKLLSGGYNNSSVNMHVNNLYITAEYAEDMVLGCDYEYITDAGDYMQTEYYMDFVYATKEDVNSADVPAESFIRELDLEHHKDLIIDILGNSYGADYNGDQIADVIGFRYIYKNALLYVNVPDGQRIYIVKAGDKISLPTVYAGKEVSWRDYSDQSIVVTGEYVVPSDVVDGNEIYLGIVYGDFVPVDPNPEEKPEEKPVVKLEEEKVEEVKDQILDAVNNSTNTDTTEPEKIQIDMKKEDGTVATEVPKDILEAAKGQNVELVLDMGDYSWTINGSDILATNLEDINLEVSLDTDNIPSAKIEALAKGEETYQLSLTHNGNFGFKANLTINLGKDKVGQYGNLYYYDSDGKLIFMNAGKIDENGNVDLSFSHASEYVVVISETEAKSPDMGDDFNMGYYVAILLLGVAMISVSFKKKMQM